MKPRALLLLLAIATAACDRAAPATNGGGDMGAQPVDLRMASAMDLAMPADLATEPEPDLARATDLARPPDLPVSGCKSDKDCRLYSNTCAAVKPNPCVCIPLPANAPDPPCLGPRVLCDTDPCDGKQPACDLMTGQCK